MSFWQVVLAWFAWNVAAPLIGFVLLCALLAAFAWLLVRKGQPEKMTLEEKNDERDVLRYMSADTHKFAIPVNGVLPQKLQEALERLMLRDWIRLIDVSPTPAATGDYRLMRVFRVMPVAVEWYKVKEWYRTKE